MDHFLNYIDGQTSIDTYRKPTAAVTDVDDIERAYKAGASEQLTADLTGWIKEFGGNIDDDNLERLVEGIFGLCLHDYPELRDIQRTSKRITCEKSCEGNAYQIEIRQLKANIDELESELRLTVTTEYHDMIVAEAMKLVTDRSGRIEELDAELVGRSKLIIELCTNIEELESANVMINKRLDWTVADNAKKAIRIDELKSAITNYDDCDSAAQSRKAMNKMLKLVNKEVIECR